MKDKLIRQYKALCKAHNSLTGGNSDDTLANEVYEKSYKTSCILMREHGMSAVEILRLSQDALDEQKAGQWMTV